MTGESEGRLSDDLSTRIQSRSRIGLLDCHAIAFKALVCRIGMDGMGVKNSREKAL